MVHDLDRPTSQEVDPLSALEAHGPLSSFMVHAHPAYLPGVSYGNTTRYRVNTVGPPLFLVIAAYYTHTRFLLPSVIDNGVLPHLMRQTVNVQFTLCPDICSKLMLQFSMRWAKRSLVIVGPVCSISQ